MSGNGQETLQRWRKGVLRGEDHLCIARACSLRCKCSTAVSQKRPFHILACNGHVRNLHPGEVQRRLGSHSLLTDREGT